MTRTSAATGLVLALACTIVLVLASHVPIASAVGADAVLRLAFRARPERIETCVAPNQAALEALPPHMRQSRICEGRSASYRLEVRRNGTMVMGRDVHGGGLRHDRPLYVFHELAIPPGEAEISVRFTREPAIDAQPDAGAPVAGGGAATGLEQADLRQAIPAEVVLERRIVFGPRDVVLVSYDPDRRAFVIVNRP